MQNGPRDTQECLKFLKNEEQEGRSTVFLDKVAPSLFATERGGNSGKGKHSVINSIYYCGFANEKLEESTKEAVEIVPL